MKKVQKAAAQGAGFHTATEIEEGRSALSTMFKAHQIDEQKYTASYEAIFTWGFK